MADKVKKDENVSTSQEHGDAVTVAEGDKTFEGTIDDIVKKLLDDAETVESDYHDDDTWDNMTMAWIYRDIAQNVRSAHDKEMRVLYKRLDDVARRLESDIAQIRYENDMLRVALELYRDATCRHVCHDLQIEHRVWGEVPEVAVIFRRCKPDYLPGFDKYKCDLMIQDRPFAPVAVNFALDTVLRLFRYAITGDGGPADQLLEKD